MATTYKDMTGRVFPLNMSGKPQGFFDGNKFVFPQFKRSSAAVIPAVDPVMPVVQQPDYFRLPANTQQLRDQGGGDVMTNDDFNDMNEINQDTSRYNEMDNPPGMFGSNIDFGISAPRGYTMAGETIGSFLGPLGTLAGGIAGGMYGGRGNQGITGNALGSLLGFAAGGPIGMGLGGLLGGGLGDSMDADDAAMPEGYFADLEADYTDPFQAIADAMSGDDAVSDIGADTSDYTGFGFGEDDGFGMV